MNKKHIIVIAALLASIAGMSVRADAQAWDKNYVKSLILAGNGTDVTNTITLLAPTLSPLSPYTITLPIGPPISAGLFLTSTTGGVMSWTSASASNWLLTGNSSIAAGSYLGTTDANDLVFKTVGTTAMTIGGASNAQNVGIGIAPTTNLLSVNGNIQMTNSTNDKITTNNTELVLEQTGDTYGTTRLHLQNRNGSNSALFEQAGSVNLCDFGFKPGTGVQSNIRLEDRSGTIRNTANNAFGEFEFFMNTLASGGSATYNFSTGEGATSIELGNFGLGMVNPTQLLQMQNGNLLLSNTSATADQLQFQGTSTGTSTFQAGAQGAKYINYTLPTLGTVPAASQVLTINTLSGSGTSGSPYAAALIWATPTTGTVTSVNVAIPGMTSSGAITTSGTITMSGDLSLANGGTNASLTASNGGIFWSNATQAQILAGTSTAKQILLSGASATPAWSTATYPSTTTASSLLYSNGANTIAALATANNGVLATNSSGVPSISITPTLGVAGTSTGTLSFGNTTGANLTTIEAGASAPAVTYSLPTNTPVTGDVLTLGTVTGSGPYTAPLTWVAGSAAAGNGVETGATGDANLPQTASGYYYPFNEVPAGDANQASESINSKDAGIFNVTTTLSSLDVVMGTAPVGANSATYAIWTNHGGSWAASGITVTITNGATTATDATHTLTVSPGDQISMKITTNYAAGGEAAWAFSGGTPSSTGMTNPMTTTGDVIYSSDNSGDPARLGVGTISQFLGVASGVPAWTSTLTDNAIGTGTTTYGLTLTNTTAATSGATQQYSPALLLTGAAYRSGSSSGSQTDSWIIQDQPQTAASATTTSNLIFGDITNGGALSTDAILSSGGMLTLGPTAGETGALALGNSANSDLTTIQPSATTPTSSFVYQLPAQTAAPHVGDVLSITSVTTVGSVSTVALQWGLAAGSYVHYTSALDTANFAKNGTAAFAMLGSSSGTSFTPHASGHMLITVSGNAFSYSGGGGCLAELRYGVGTTAPAAGAAVTGTLLGGFEWIQPLGAGHNEVAPFTSTQYLDLSGSLGTACWVDVAFAASASGVDATIGQTQISVIELP